MPFTGALRLSGMTAPMVLDGPMNGDAFQAYIEQVLAPHSSRRDRHHEPHPPDFNPIENTFFKLKALPRKHAARTIDDLRDTIHDALPEFIPSERANYIKAAGYRPE